MPPELDELSRNLTDSYRSHRENLFDLRRAFALLNALGQHAQGQNLGARDGFRAGGTVSHHTRNLRNLGDPAAIGLLFSFNGKSHGGEYERDATKIQARDRVNVQCDLISREARAEEWVKTSN